MSGGLGGMEMDEVPVVRVQSPSPQKRNGKGKERAVESDGQERRGRSKEMKSISFFFFSHLFPLVSLLSFKKVAQLFVFRTTKRFKIAT